MKQLRSSKPVAYWLLVGVAMIIVQIILGGITRLTGSGLSITEWDVITGTIPPVNEQQWIGEFQKYQQTPQYRLLNADFTLNDFKAIYFWEWLHRLWGRLIGIVFIIPFVIFLLQRRFRPQMIKPLLILFLLGALQGAVGWIMVVSGLTGDAVYVRPTRLALHFILALLLLAYTFWFALQLLVKETNPIAAPSLKKFTVLIITILFVQFFFGALVAGHKAAPAAPTWPLVNDSFIPSYVFRSQQGWRSIIENPVTIQTIHRLIAYLLVLLIFLWTVKAFKQTRPILFKKVRLLPAVFVILQLLLGIFTVLSSVQIRANKWNNFEWLALFHQLTALSLLLSLVLALFILRKKNLKRLPDLNPHVI
ncbi:MAG: COX15/CtaA family protein [Chitinophagaceae bacterium]